MVWRRGKSLVPVGAGNLARQVHSLVTVLELSQLATLKWMLRKYVGWDGLDWTGLDWTAVAHDGDKL